MTCDKAGNALAKLRLGVSDWLRRQYLCSDWLEHVEFNSVPVKLTLTDTVLSHNCLLKLINVFLLVTISLSVSGLILGLNTDQI